MKKTYMIVTNDKYELPVSDEIVGAREVAERLGIKLQRFRRCLCDGFPKKAKYKAVIIKNKQFGSMDECRRYHSKRYTMTHDRTEYYRQYYLRKRRLRSALREEEVHGQTD